MSDIASVAVLNGGATGVVTPTSAVPAASLPASRVTISPIDGVDSSTVQGALAELAAGGGGGGGASAAEDVTVAAISGLTATDAQAAFAEHQGKIEALEGRASTLESTASDHDGRITTLESSSHAAVTLGAVGSTPNGNGASLSGQALTLQPADGSSPGVLTASAQTIGGDKTLSGRLLAANGSAATPAISFANSNATGIYRESDGFMNTAHAGAQSFRFGPTGVLYGNTAAANLTMNGSIGVALTWSGVSTFAADGANARLVAPQCQLRGTTAGTATAQVRGAAGQTANLLELNVNGGSAVAHVTKDGEIEITGAGVGIVLKSPDGTRYRLTVANGGTLSITAV